jgi:hypothetical protein
VQAQADGEINPQLPPEVVLYTVFARACDPVPAFLRAGGQYADTQIVDWVMSTCFGGLAGPVGRPAANSSTAASPALAA